MRVTRPSFGRALYPGLLILGLSLPVTAQTSPAAGQRLAPGATEQDYQVFPFVATIGMTRAAAEGCTADPHVDQARVAKALSQAEVIARGRYRQLGLDPALVGTDANTSYRNAHVQQQQTPQANPCALFPRRLENLYAWAASEGADFVNATETKTR